MSRYEVKLTMRRPPWFVRLLRWLRNPNGNWPTMESDPWWHHWFAILVPYRFRTLHEAYAATHGYFWKPCPLCDRPFGGHEWRQVAGRPSTVPDPMSPPAPDQTGPIISLGKSIGICPRCTAAGRGVDDLAGYR